MYLYRLLEWIVHVDPTCITAKWVKMLRQMKVTRWRYIEFFQARNGRVYGVLKLELSEPSDELNKFVLWKEWGTVRRQRQQQQKGDSGFPGNPNLVHPQMGSPLYPNPSKTNDELKVTVPYLFTIIRLDRFPNSFSTPLQLSLQVRRN